jgi:hypothetical protein
MLWAQVDRVGPSEHDRGCGDLRENTKEVNLEKTNNVKHKEGLCILGHHVSLACSSCLSGKYSSFLRDSFQPCAMELEPPSTTEHGEHDMACEKPRINVQLNNSRDNLDSSTRA